MTVVERESPPSPSRADAGSDECKPQSVRAAVDTHAVSSATVFPEIFFKALDHGAANEASRIQCRAEDLA